jgi:hypothetical protein
MWSCCSKVPFVIAACGRVPTDVLASCCEGISIEDAGRGWRVLVPHTFTPGCQYVFPCGREGNLLTLSHATQWGD